MADKGKTDRKSGYGAGADKKSVRSDREGKAGGRDYEGGGGKGKGGDRKGKGKGEKGKKGGRGDNAFADYLRYHRVQFELEEMVNDVLIDKPANPFEVLAKLLKEKSATYDVPEAPKKKSAGNASKKKAASHDLASTDDFPTMGA